jgi:hypothetical protein
MPKKGGVYMSKKCCKMTGYNEVLGGGYNTNCCCNFPMLIILILIVLQFSKRKSDGYGKDVVGNGVLFIIALYFLSCCNPCNKR